MNPYWSPKVADLSPYVPGEQPKRNNLVKLNTNENPYGPSPRVIEAIRREAGDGLRLYPEPDSYRLCQTVARYHNLDPAQVFVGNGSDEVLAHAFFALFQHSRPILFPDISYSFYPVYCELYGIRYQTIPLEEDFRLNLDPYRVENGGIIFPNPNAPTGLLLELDAIEGLLEDNRDSAVVIDEAYVDFGGESAIKLIKRFPNLLVTQTLSKSRSLAGMRVGLAFGHEELIEALVRVKDSFNSYPLDLLASSAAIASYEDEAYFLEIRSQIMLARDWVTRELQALNFEVLPSSANFILAAPPNRDAAGLAARLREQGVIVRHFRQPRIDSYLRITIGTPEENRRLIQAVTESLT
ncbi:MAG: histidinol-phosphate transaminase [Candidatus Thiodiazotropha sp.]